MGLFKHSIFMRIYAGVVALVALVAICAYVIVQIINDQRAQSYREDMADGVAFVLSQVLAQQPTPQAQQDWLSDVSQVVELPIDLISHDDVLMTRTEQYRLGQNRAVVRYDQPTATADIYSVVDNLPNHYLHIRVNKLTETQLKVIPILIMEDLVYHVGAENQRLQQLQAHFPYPLSFRRLSDLNLDRDQISRLRLDKTQTILLYKDSASMQGTTLSALTLFNNNAGQVLMLGPVPMFNWLPFRLFAGATLFSLLLLSLGVYALMRPLERRIGRVTQALNRVRRGDMNVRVDDDTNTDEIGQLGSSFNTMTEHIQRLIESQRELTRAVSHELRTPVARIRFGMEMLTDTDDYDSRLQQMEMIDADIQSLDSLIEEILTYAKLEQGMPSLTFEMVPLTELLQQVATESAKLKHGRTLTLDLPEDHLMVEAERRYLHRVVQNFVGNAVRYSQQEIRISGGVVNGLAYVYVEDDGDGVPEKDRLRVFEAFARLDDSRTRASGGYGLGLSIVSRIAYWFGGTATVDQSPELGGARFIMRWPAHQVRKAVLLKDTITS